MRVKNNTIGSLTGIVGDLCLYEVGGKLVCRSLPRRDKKKASAAQITCRNTFASRVGIAQSVKYTLLRRVWKYTEFPVGMNSLNHFLKINKGAFGRTDLIIYPLLFFLSDGYLSPVINFEMTRFGGFAAMQCFLQ
ncbi:MAG: hypothetical protein Q8859_12055, partial [Bacteroidota bacterium]|nr:hypothetical protein [Bacteroidota bacterium]